jgi:diguanylate cyclase (GGDEF)-like protein
MSGVNMINTKNCIIEYPIEGLDVHKWQQLVNMMAELFDAASGVIVQYRQQTFNVVATSDNQDNFLHVNSSWPWDIQSFCRRIIESNDKLYVNNALSDDEWACVPPVSDGPVRSYLGYPLYWPNGSLFGSFCVIDTKATDYSEPLRKMLGQLKLIVEGELQHVENITVTKALLAEKIAQEQQLKKLALYDQLTDCANRNLLAERINYQISQAFRQKTQFCIIYFDLDKFKPINDNHGHQCGDFVLASIGKKIKAAVRETDTVARVGGDEFVIVMNKKINDSKIKQKLIDIIEAPILCGETRISISASIGISTYPDDGKTMEILLAAADSDMYEDKAKNLINN